MKMNMIIVPETAHINLSANGYHFWAIEYRKYAKLAISSTKQFSPVPYSLLYHAIELEIKAKIIRRGMSPADAKEKFQHNIFRAYEALDASEKTLDKKEESTLKKATAIQKQDSDKRAKRFEYFYPLDALRGYRGFPDLKSMVSIADKLIPDIAPDIS